MAVSDEKTLEIQEQVAKTEGLLLCPEGAAVVAAYAECIETGLVSTSDSVVLFNTATGLKYPMPEVVSSIDKNDVDFSIFTK